MHTHLITCPLSMRLLQRRAPHAQPRTHKAANTSFGASWEWSTCHCTLTPPAQPPYLPMQAWLTQPCTQAGQKAPKICHGASVHINMVPVCAHLGHAYLARPLLARAWAEPWAWAWAWARVQCHVQAHVCGCVRVYMCVPSWPFLAWAWA